MHVIVVPPQVPLPLQTSLYVQALPSLQLVPEVAFDHAVFEVAGVQTWHAFPGFTVPEA